MFQYVLEIALLSPAERGKQYLYKEYKEHLACFRYPLITKTPPDSSVKLQSGLTRDNVFLARHMSHSKSPEPH